MNLTPMQNKTKMFFWKDHVEAIDSDHSSVDAADDFHDQKPKDSFKIYEN